MNKDNINLLTLKQFYLILSKKTSKPYIDKNFKCYLFESDYDAKQFCDKISDTYFENQGFIKQGPFISMCYGYGIERIQAKCSTDEKFKEIPIEKNDVKRQFYNRDTSRSILRLKQTRQKQYLLELNKGTFLSPIIIDQRKEGEYPIVHYTYAILSQNTIHYLLFTTLQEFEEWKVLQKNKDYLPNQTTLSELNKIRGKNPVFINPLSDKLILTDVQIKSITRNKN